MTKPHRFTASDPNFAARVRANFARQGVMALIGARLGDLEPGYCEIRLPFRTDLSQQHGYYHAGVTSTIADSAAGYAGYTLMPADSEVLTVEYKMNLLAPADGESMIARGRVVRAGRTLVVARADVDVIKDGRETACATLLQTLICVRHPDSDDPKDT